MNTFDTLAYAQFLEARGLDRKTAEAHAQGMTKFVLPALATKGDIDRLETTLTVRMITVIVAVCGLLDAALFFALKR